MVVGVQVIILLTPGHGFSEIFDMMSSQIPKTLFQNTLKFLVDVVNSETAPLASVAVQALGHIALRVPLPSLIVDSSSGS